MVGGFKVICVFAKPTEIHSLGGLESVNSQPTHEIKFIFINMRVLIYESQQNFFRGF